MLAHISAGYGYKQEKILLVMMEHGDCDAQTGGIVLLSLSNFCREDATLARRIDKWV